MKRSIVLVMAVGLVSAPVCGQSINVDCGGRSGVPGSDYAAAGLPGVWNALTTAARAPQPLVGLTGEPVAATITHDSGLARTLDDPGTTADAEGLMDDGLVDALLTVRFDGLLDGTYQVIAYAWTPGDPGASMLVSIDGDADGARITGGPWPGALEPGLTHVTREVVVAGGELSIEVSGDGGKAPGFLNGVQLRRLTRPDLDADGIVGLEDFMAMLAVWGPCPDPCPPDLDGDGAVDVSDVLILLDDWG